LEILKKCKQNGISTAVDTAGHIPFENFEKILPFTDMFLYDFKIFDSEKHKKYIGVGNELILENLKKLLNLGAKVYIRIPVIEGVNDSIEEMQQIKEFLYKNGKPEKVELLPYHSMGENKYRAIGKQPQIFKTPDKEKIKELREIF
jgi:pyruvate formate lyase activating enzyme